MFSSSKNIASEVELFAFCVETGSVTGVLRIHPRPHFPLQRTPIDILYERSINSYRHSVGARRVGRDQANLL
jgi:hypothetical protein